MSSGEIIQHIPETSFLANTGTDGKTDLKSLEFAWKQDIYDQSLMIGADWLEAAGGEPITIEQFQNLFEADKVSYSANDILSVFLDWNDFQNFTATEVEDRQALQNVTSPAVPGATITRPESRDAILRELLAVGNKTEPQKKRKIDKSPAISKRPEYRFSKRSHRIVVLGKAALSEKGEDSGKRYLETLFNLGKLVVQDEIDEPDSDYITITEALSKEAENELDIKKQKRGTFPGREKADYVSYGKWLLSVLDPPVNPRERTISIGLLRRSFQRGLGPSADRIISFFGTMANFYDEIDAIRVTRVGRDNDLTEADIIVRLQQIAKETGQRPHRRMLWNRFKSGEQSISPEMISKVISDGSRPRALSTALEKAGWPMWRGKSDTVYIEWGVRFVLANQGLLPTEKVIGLLSSSNGLAPSSRTLKTKFGSLTRYQGVVRQAVTIKTEIENEDDFETIKTQAPWLLDDKYRAKLSIPESATPSHKWARNRVDISHLAKAA